ncbi:MAG: hypothetical protein J6A49_04955 [Clostridia bacterium]|nr:hypothetical protein [Clostridia bacterium]
MMENSYPNELVYSLKVFKSNCDVDFLKAMDIYRNNIVWQEKTPLQEIAWVAENSHRFQTSKPVLFGITLNNTIIGYAETAYIPKTKFITIDYLILDRKYNTHSAFYTFLMLIVEYFNCQKYDYDFIITEKLVKSPNGEGIEELDEFQLEGFKVINQLYIQPKLELNNTDSEQEAVLLLYQRNANSPYISKETYCNLVEALYFDYYYEWDSFFLKGENQKAENYNRLKENLEKIKVFLKDEEIELNGYPFKKISNETTIIPFKDNKRLKPWKALIFLILFCVVALGVVLALKKMNAEIIIVCFIFVLLLFVWLAFIALSDERALAILEKIPFVSKIFEQLK